MAKFLSLPRRSLGIGGPRLALTALFLLLVSLLNFPATLATSYWINTALLFAGGGVGFVLVELDHLLYALLAAPHELSSQRITSFLRQKKVKASLALLADTVSERRKLFFHSALFQLLFLAVVLFVISSSASFFGKGLVLAFSLQLLFKQLQEYQSQGQITSWFWNFRLNLTPTTQQLYLWGLFALHLLFALWA